MDIAIILCCQVKAGHSNAFAVVIYVLKIGPWPNEYCIAGGGCVDAGLYCCVVTAAVLFDGEDGSVGGE